MKKSFFTILDNKILPIEKIILILAIGNLLLSVEYYRLAHIDDAWLMSFYYNLIQQNEIYSIAAGNQMTVFSMAGINAFLYENVARIFPSILYAHKYFSLLLAFASLYLIYSIVYKVTKSKVFAVRSAALVALIEHFVASSHFARQEIIILFLSLLSVFFVLKDSHEKYQILPGFFLTLAMLIHPISGVFLFGILIIKFEENNKDLKYFLSGFMAGLIFSMFYLVSLGDFNQLVNYETLLNSFRFIASQRSVSSFVDREVEILLVTKYYRFFIYYIVAVVSIVLLLTRKESKDKIFVKVGLAVYLGYLLLGRNQDHYYILVFIFFFIYLSQFQTLFITLSLVYLAFWFAVYSIYGGADYEKYSKNLISSASCLDKVDLIIGSMNDWHMFRDRRFRSYMHPRWTKEMQYKKTMLILNQNVKDFLKDNRENEQGVAQFQKISLDKHTIVATFRDQYYGGAGKRLDNEISIYCPLELRN